MIIERVNDFLKRNSKRICIILVGMIVFVNCFSFGTIFAGENNKLNSGITFTYNTKKYEASKKEIQEYEKYGIKDGSLYSQNNLIKTPTRAMYVDERSKKNG